jgi:hypothetical protein
MVASPARADVARHDGATTQRKMEPVAPASEDIGVVVVVGTIVANAKAAKSVHRARTVVVREAVLALDTPLPLLPPLIRIHLDIHHKHHILRNHRVHGVVVGVFPVEAVAGPVATCCAYYLSLCP